MRIPTHCACPVTARIVVPKAVRAAFGGRPEIKASLHTRNLKLALVGAKQFAVEADDSFAKVHSPMGVKKVDPSDRKKLRTQPWAIYGCGLRVPDSDYAATRVV